MCVPTPDGVLHPLVLVAAAQAGVDEIWRIGGAQAIAALAYGTATHRRGRQDRRPRQRLGRRGQAAGVRPGRHRPDRRALGDPRGRRPRPGPGVARGRPPEPGRARRARPGDPDHRRRRTSPTRSRRRSRRSSRTCRGRRSQARAGATSARSSWSPISTTAPALVDRLAPEHLELVGPRAEALAARIRHAGSIFIGAHTPEVVGDYVGGPNHVLPTGRTARFASGLSVYDFLKRTTLLACPAAALRELGPAAVRLAERRGAGRPCAGARAAARAPSRRDERRRRQPGSPRSSSTAPASCAGTARSSTSARSRSST